MNGESVRVQIGMFYLRDGLWTFPEPTVPRRALELASTIKSTFESVIQTNLYPRSHIDIVVLVLQQDGALLQACINATALAIASAGIPMLDLLCAVTIGIHATSPILDLTLVEENDTPNLTVGIMPRTDKVSLLTMDTRLHADHFKDTVALASTACKVIHTEMKAALHVSGSTLVNVNEAGIEGNNAHEHDITHGHN